MQIPDTGVVKQKKGKKFWAIIAIIILIVILIAVAGAYFYFIYYLKSNFEVNDFNNISSNTVGKITPDSNITYTIDFKNTGNTAVNSFTILTKIPLNTTFVSSVPNCKFNQPDNSLEFKLGILSKGQSGKVTYTVKVNKPLDNGIMIRSEEAIFKFKTRGKDENFKLTKILENIVESSPDFKNFNIEVVDENGGDFNMGDLAIFTISVENTGNMNAKNVKIIDSIPAKLEVVESSIKPQQPPSQYDRQNKKITWNLEKLNVGEVVKLSFEAKIGDNFSHLEKFKNIADLQYDGNIKNEIFVEKEVHAFPDFSKSTNTATDADGGSIWAGDVLIYTIIVRNTGLREGEDFKLYCPIPAGTSYVGGSATPEGFSLDDKTGELQWQIKRLGIGEEKTFTFKVKISDSMKKGGEIVSDFYILGDSQNVKIEPISVKVMPFIFQTIVCMGDSHIIHTNWPAVLNQLVHNKYPHAEFNTIGSGVPQEMAYQGARRFDSTVKVYNPQIIVIGYGTNDTGTPGGTELFRSGLDELIKKAKSTGATVLVHSIGYIDTVKNPGKASYLAYNDVIRGVCASNGVPYVDLYGPMSQDPGRYLDSDGMHWTNEGGTLLANLVFNTLVNYLDSNGRRK